MTDTDDDVLFRCELCDTRLGPWRGHVWACDQCVARVVRDFRAGHERELDCCRKAQHRSEPV